MEGIVVKSTGSWFLVKENNGDMLPSRIKGRIRLKGLTTTNPVAVGDKVRYEYENSGDEQIGVINEILPRNNYIIRKSNNLSKQGQIIAANIDQALLIVTLSAPKTSLGFIDRFLVTAEAYHIPVCLVFNKQDLYNEEDVSLANYLMQLYDSLGYKCLMLSATEKDADAVLLPICQGKLSLLCGHSGVGKSTILNLLVKNATQKTNTVSKSHEVGKHTTTFAEMFSINESTAVIDTPGIRDFGVIDLDKAEISHYFPEMKELLPKCRFHNCVHLNEPGCAVINAAEEGNVAPSRYYNYVSILNNEDVFN
ncbi:MAG: ribosome small subunit-dependent GTPase A [Bacteroidia bacterium]|nr:ribosome small subunit-dependent GTPase A [Bacteroidia bacterium]